MPRSKVTGILEVEVSIEVDHEEGQDPKAVASEQWDAYVGANNTVAIESEGTIEDVFEPRWDDAEEV